MYKKEIEELKEFYTYGEGAIDTFLIIMAINLAHWIWLLIIWVEDKKDGTK